MQLEDGPGRQTVPTALPRDPSEGIRMKPARPPKGLGSNWNGQSINKYSVLGFIGSFWVVIEAFLFEEFFHELPVCLSCPWGLGSKGFQLDLL